MALGIEPSQSSGILISPAMSMRWFITPYKSLNSQRQTRTATTVETKYGNRIRLRANERKTMFWCSIKAAATPNTI